MPMIPSALIVHLEPIVRYVGNDYERLGKIVEYLSSSMVLYDEKALTNSTDIDSSDTEIDPSEPNDPMYMSFDTAPLNNPIVPTSPINTNQERETDSEYGNEDRDKDDSEDNDEDKEGKEDTSSEEIVQPTPPPTIRTKRAKRVRPVIDDSDNDSSGNRIPDFDSFDMVLSGKVSSAKAKRGGKYLSKQVAKGLWVNGDISIGGRMAPTRDRSNGRCVRCVRMKEDKCVVLKSVSGVNLPFMSSSCGNCVRAGQKCG